MDIKTLIIVSFVTLSMLTITSYVLMRHFPTDKSLKYFFAFSFLFFIGQIFTGLRNIIPDFFSIIIGNNLLISGHILLYIAVRGLLSMEVRWYNRYFIPIGVVLMGFIFFTYFIYDIQMRIVIFSLFCALYGAIIGWLFWEHASSEFKILNRFTAILFFLSTVMFIVRAVKSTVMQLPANYLNNTEITIVLPYIYLIIITIWLSLVFTLQTKIRNIITSEYKSNKN